ncbi:organic cation transporter-like protein [Pomacea canaliculata]|uniref:organic cation transporter-like protein n=1 Tax=Pomacea canaliculata TaxID=400727 RepID=UPI000D73B6B2|nr:organic cation transporter-like protein [Pomacea canaliculata]
MNFDEVVQAIKPFGRYQQRNYLLTCLLGIPASIHTMVTVFILATPEHRCSIPGLDNDTWQSQGPEHDELVRQMIPFDTRPSPHQCTLFKYRSLQTPDDVRNDTAKCSQWVYNKEVFDLTVISELNLVCEDKNLVTLANSILMGGLFCGSIILGTLSDLIGRKKTMLIGIAGQFCVALATGFISNYIAFIVLRFLTTLFGIGFYLAAFVAALELVGPDKRVLAGVLIGLFWCVGLFLILLLAYLLPNWHHLQIAVSCVNLLFFPYYWLIPESPRWLVSRGRIQEASAIVRHAASSTKLTCLRRSSASRTCRTTVLRRNSGTCLAVLACCFGV